MSPNFKSKINVVHVVEFVLALIVAICFADNECIHCGRHIIQMQLITATAYGILIFITIVFIGLFIDEPVGQKSDMIFSALAGVLSVVSAILVLVNIANDSERLDDYQYFRQLVGGSALILNGVLFLVEFFLLIFSKEKLDA